MQESLKKLVELQELDAAIRSRQKQRDCLPGLIKGLEDRRAGAKAGLDRVREALETARKNKRDRDADLAAGAQKVEKLKARTAEIKTNKEYQAMLKEIETAEQENKAIEDDIIGLMEQIDKAAAEITTAEGKLKEDEAAIAEEQRRHEEAFAKLEAELKLQEEERRKIASQIDEQLLTWYQKLYNSKGGIAVVEAHNESCTGCRMRIPPQLYVRIKKKDGIHDCPHCYRILYFKETIAPAS